MPSNRNLLFFIDEGGFEDPSNLFTKLGYTVTIENNPRKVNKLAKKNTYDVLVAQFSYNPEFRDRVSNIESLLATLEQSNPSIKTIILFDDINAPQLEQFKKRYRLDYFLSIPFKHNELEDILLKF
jgi:DNA-binding NtrC family response regulator